jgi:hypothetical protein
METSLGLAGTPDEPWRPRLLLRISLLGSLGLAALIALGRLFRGGEEGEMPRAGRKSGGSAIRRRGRNPEGPMSRRAGLVLLLVFWGLCLWGLFDGRGLPGGRRSGVLRETAARRIPDSAGTIAAFFREGQPVRARSRSGSWVWVETPDTSLEAGWIPAEDVIFYTD